MASSSSTSSSTAIGYSPFSVLSDDIVLNILLKLEADPRDWARLSCVSTRFSALIRDVCYKTKCIQSSPPELLPLPASTSVASLHKLSICCPGLLHSGVLLEHSDFGLELDIGPDHLFRPTPPPPDPTPPTLDESDAQPGWSLFDDLYYDTVYDISEAHIAQIPDDLPAPAASPAAEPPAVGRKRKAEGISVGTHLAEERWNLSREQGKKLLASRFLGDALFLTEFPGCVHPEERRSYMVFRGLFKDFKRTRVWRAISDGKRRAIELACAYCACTEMWDLHAAFCLRRVFGYHDDGEPVVRAYVCDNGHVSGAWTERPACG